MPYLVVNMCSALDGPATIPVALPELYVNKGQPQEPTVHAAKLSPAMVCPCPAELSTVPLGGRQPGLGCAIVPGCSRRGRPRRHVTESMPCSTHAHRPVYLCNRPHRK